MKYLILAQSPTTAQALGAWLDLLGEKGLVDLSDERILLQRGPEEFPGKLVSCFRQVADTLGDMLEARWREEIVVLVDSVNAGELNAVGSPNGWNRLISLLILAFPEIRWAFGIVTGSDKGVFEREHTLCSLFNAHYDPLFDGTGLRHHVRKLTAKHEVETAEGKAKVAPWIPQRNEWAVALDDEAVYSYLHAYIAFRNGFRGYAVHSQILADQLLKEDKDSEGKNVPAPFLTLEDYFLGFPDKGDSKPTSNLYAREGQWKLLSRAKIRHFISGGHRRGKAAKTLLDNRSFRIGLRTDGRGGLEATKPVPGIFALWKQLRLKRNQMLFRGLAPHFVWPWNDQTHHERTVDSTSGHSAPGLLLMVAEHLIDRAGRITEKVHDVSDAVRGAVLATSALELLGPKTPTTAREALELKHRFEVLAECQFGGIQYNLELDDRFDEIQRDVKLLGRWYGVRARDAAVLNGELTILSRLIKIFRDYEEFDEEEICRRRIRTLHRKIWWKQHRKNPINWIVWLFRYYIELLLGSVTRFATAMIAWVVGLAFAFSFLKPGMEQRITAGQGSGDLPSGLSQSMAYFFGTEPLNGAGFLWTGLTILAILSGFVHLGVFISQVYSMVARR